MSAASFRRNSSQSVRSACNLEDEVEEEEGQPACSLASPPAMRFGSRRRGAPTGNETWGRWRAVESGKNRSRPKLLVQAELRTPANFLRNGTTLLHSIPIYHALKPPLKNSATFIGAINRRPNTRPSSPTGHSSRPWPPNRESCSNS